jgi:hypothetical protein
MATILLIQEAIVSLKDRTGSSVIAINKYLETEKKVCSFPVENDALSVCCVLRANCIDFRHFDTVCSEDSGRYLEV